MTGTSESAPPPPPLLLRVFESMENFLWPGTDGPWLWGVAAELGGAVELEAYVGIPPPTLCSLVSAHLPRDCGPRTLARHSAREVGWVFLS